MHVLFRASLRAAPTIVVTAVAACASRPPAAAETPTPVPVPEAPAPSAPAARPSRFAWAPAVRRVEVRTTVDVTREPQAVGDGAEQVQTVVYLSDTLASAPLLGGAAAGAVRVTGIVDSVAVVASERVRGAAAEARLAPFAYQAASDARGVRVDPAPGAAVDLRCTAPGGALALGALAAVREALPRVPAGGVEAGARWRDTTVTARCAGPVLLVVQTVSRYEAAPGDGGLVAVTRRSASSFRGQGAAGVRPLTVQGSGTAETRYLLDPARGALAGGAGEGRTTLTVTAAGQAQRFVQRTRTEVRAADAGR